MCTLEAIRYDQGKLEILNQLLLPCESIYEDISSVDDAWKAIKEMKVRGAPAIAIVGCLSVAVELHKMDFVSAEDICTFIVTKLEYLVTARPTAVNMAKVAAYLKDYVGKCQLDNKAAAEIKQVVIETIENMMKKDIEDNINIGDYGAKHIVGNVMHDQNVIMMTHCNTGSLATSGYGTALGVIRSINKLKRIDHVFCTETRPYNQGSRLTAYELVHEKIPSTLIADSAASLVMKSRQISAVVVGADRVVANGDTANKIGTYQLAIAAKHHGIPFYIAAPSSSIDFTLNNGDDIVIEERKQEELTHFKGQQIAAEGIGCFNPAFDVTPAELITGGIITEFGVFKPSELKEKLMTMINQN